MSVITNKRCKRQWKKGLKNIKGTLFIKRKTKSYLPLPLMVRVFANDPGDLGSGRVIPKI